MRRRRESEADELADGLFDMLMMLLWWAGPVVAGLAFVVLHFAVPLLSQRLSAGSSDNVGVNAMGTMLSQVFGGVSAMLAPLFAGAVIVIWLVTLYRKRERRQLLNKTTELEKVRSLHWQDFEHLVGEYYRRRGYTVQERGGSSPDGGVDIVISKDGRRTRVQCKHWKVFKVGIAPVRELLGVVTHAGAEGGILVTSGQFTTEAYDFAEQSRIELFDGERVMEMIRSVQDARHETPVRITDPD